MFVFFGESRDGIFGASWFLINYKSGNCVLSCHSVSSCTGAVLDWVDVHQMNLLEQLAGGWADGQG
jgi:hypothetical protein